MRMITNTIAATTSTIGKIRSYNTFDGTRGVCLRAGGAGGFGFSDWLILGLLIDRVDASLNGIEIVRPPVNLSIKSAYSKTRRLSIIAHWAQIVHNGTRLRDAGGWAALI
jgi:hypothetical protein